MAESRTPRDLDSRESAERPKRHWTPPQLLPEPTPEPGYAFRWVRTSTLSNADPMNISAKLREGWEPVKASQHPELQMVAASNSRFPDCVEIGGLLLCKIPEEMARERDAFYLEKSNQQMRSVDNTLMRENDPRMPLFSNKESKVSAFGRGT
jgi:hypothetical protein